MLSSIPLVPPVHRHARLSQLRGCGTLGSHKRRAALDGRSNVVRATQTPLTPRTGPQLPSTPPPSPPSGSEEALTLRRVLRRVERSLSNLELALGEMAVLAALSAVGTVIEQNKSYSYYIERYPLDPAVLGFVTYPFILDNGLDHIYSTWYFLGLNALLAASLVACSRTNQLVSLRVARDWRLPSSRKSLARMPVNATLANASVLDLASALASSGYQTFVSRSGRLYATSGLIGKMAPIAVHASMLLSMGGFLLSALGGHTGSIMVPEGSSFVLADALRPMSPLSGLLLPSSAKDIVEVDAFRVEYYPNGDVSQFFSDLGVVDVRSQQRVDAVEMKVNVPLRHGGITAYQTDWSMASVTVRVGARGADATTAIDAPPVALPMASLEGTPGFNGRIWGTFLPVPPEPGAPPAAKPRGVTLVARDFQSVAVYASDGSFAGVRRPGSGTPLVVDGVPLVVELLTGATGLELKHDPGVPIVYAGFAGIMLTTFLSFVSHSQVWAMEDAATGCLHVGGKTSKLHDTFEQQMTALLRTLPEYSVPETLGHDAASKKGE